MVINLIFEIYRLRSILRFSRLRETKVADALLLTLKVLTYSALFKTASVSRKCLKTITKDMIRSSHLFPYLYHARSLRIQPGALLRSRRRAAEFAGYHAHSSLHSCSF